MAMHGIMSISQNIATTTSRKNIIKKILQTNNISFGSFQGATADKKTILNQIGDFGKNAWKLAKNHKSISVPIGIAVGVLGAAGIAKSVQAKKEVNLKAFNA